MSIFRVITRIIPLNAPESTFEPASFEELTGGNFGEVKVLNLTEPQSGLKYRIERVEIAEHAKPGESVEDINKAYDEKLKRIPGIVRLKEGDIPFNPYDKSFQVTLPKVLLGRASNESGKSQQKSSESFKISVVKNFNFEKAKPKLKKSKTVKHSPDKLEKKDVHEDTSIKNSKSPSDSKSLFKSKYPSYLSKKIKNSVWKNKNKKPVKSPKKSEFDKSINNLDDDHTINGINTQNHDCPTTNYVHANKEIDMRKTLDVRVSQNEDGKNTKKHATFNRDADKIHNGDNTDEETEITDDSLDSECGDLIINVPEIADAHLSSVEDLSDNNEDASDKNVSAPTNNDPISVICTKYIINGNHPAHDLLRSLKRYFVNGECLICGFIPADTDFNASEHMESHVLSTSFTSSYKCSCCNEKFANPRNLYMHALSREKSYNYICSICTLKFKRRHYLSRHTSKSHNSTIK